MSTPISPKEVQEKVVGKPLHPAVTQAVNELLISKGSEDGHHHICITQDVLIAAVIAIDGTLTRDYIFDNRLLDIESQYRLAGWKVVYDKPAYNESYHANFTFSVKE